ncbi:MAG: hypothetical protein GY928_20775 [Colwellia sp.]|nr:hypothetical protein [Colwellia sp.]
MKIIITMYKDGMYLNIKNFIRKLFGLNYMFSTPTSKGMVMKIWNDKVYGSPMIVQKKIEDVNISIDGMPEFKKPSNVKEWTN